MLGITLANVTRWELSELRQDEGDDLKALPIFMRKDRFQIEAGFESLKSKSMDRADRLHANSAPGGTFTDCLSRRIPWLSSAVSARFQNDELSYAELDARANRMAHFLKSRAVGPEVLVGVCAKRSLDFAVTLLGVWKAGGAYLPLDPDYPAQRLNCLLADAKPAVILTQAALRSRFAGCPVPTVIIEELHDLRHLPRESPQASARPVACARDSAPAAAAPG